MGDWGTTHEQLEAGNILHPAIKKFGVIIGCVKHGDFYYEYNKRTGRCYRCWSSNWSRYSEKWFKSQVYLEEVKGQNHWPNRNTKLPNGKDKRFSEKDNKR